MKKYNSKVFTVGATSLWDNSATKVLLALIATGSVAFTVSTHEAHAATTDATTTASS